VIDGKDHPVLAGCGIIVPAGAVHNLINAGSQKIRLYPIYGQPEHRARLVEHDRIESQCVEMIDKDAAG
jgi:mannose-6-phosphate isomerase-like protein (cupin superfamily)